MVPRLQSRAPEKASVWGAAGGLCRAPEFALCTAISGGAKPRVATASSIHRSTWVVAAAHMVDVFAHVVVEREVTAPDARRQGAARLPR